MNGKINSKYRLKIKAEHSHTQADNVWKLQLRRLGAAFNGKLSVSAKQYVKAEVEIKALSQWKLPDKWKLPQEWKHATKVCLDNLPEELQGTIKFVKKQLPKELQQKLKWQAKSNKQTGMARLGVKWKLEFN